MNSRYFLGKVAWPCMIILRVGERELLRPVARVNLLT